MLAPFLAVLPTPCTVPGTVLCCSRNGPVHRLLADLALIMLRLSLLCWRCSAAGMDGCINFWLMGQPDSLSKVDSAHDCGITAVAFHAMGHIMATSEYQGAWVGVYAPRFGMYRTVLVQSMIPGLGASQLWHSMPWVTSWRPVSAQGVLGGAPSPCSGVCIGSVVQHMSEYMHAMA
jgi:hypothetical protein